LFLCHFYGLILITIMAQVVAQRQAVVTKTKLTQKQSTETVQVMLYTSVSAIANLLTPSFSLANTHIGQHAFSHKVIISRWHCEQSALTRQRGIFPALAFDTVEFAEDDELYTFEGLLNNKHPSRRQPSSPSSTSTRSSEPTTLNVPLLKRGRSVRVDQFLDSLVGYTTGTTIQH
jgi:hypothetical protein